MPLTIGYIVGSLSEKSINRQLLRAITSLAGDELELHEVEIGRLPLYNRDHDDDFPPEATQLKETIRTLDGLLFVTPEYNRSIPAALKNALEWASRPYGQNALAGIPAGIMGASPGGPGTALSQQHLRNVLAYLDVPTMGQPEAFIQFTSDRFAEDGTVLDESTAQFLRTWLASYTTWVRRFAD